jgi:hypothetical protein
VVEEDRVAVRVSVTFAVSYSTQSSLGEFGFLSRPSTSPRPFWRSSIAFRRDPRSLFHWPHCSPGKTQAVRSAGPTPEHGVAEEADRHRPNAGEPVESDIRRDLAPVHGLVQGRQRRGAQERRRKKLVLGRDLDPLTRQMEDDAAVDDESGHAAVDATALRSVAAARRRILPVDVARARSAMVSSGIGSWRRMASHSQPNCESDVAVGLLECLQLVVGHAVEF